MAASWRAAFWISGTILCCADGGWTYYRVVMVFLNVKYRLVAASFRRPEKVFVFGKNMVSTRPGYTGGENYMDGGLAADWGRKNIRFSTPSETVLDMKKRHRINLWPDSAKNNV